MKKNAALFLGSTLLAFGLTLVIDWAVGVYLKPFNNLVYEPYTVASFATPEFQFEARANNLGFRDRNFDLQKEKKYRILTLGDSMTWGWGVQVNQAWPKVLEQRLQARQIDVEVANLGKAGAWATEDADIAKKAVPLLRPDLVVVAMTQVEDLGQTIVASSMAGMREKMSPADWDKAWRSSAARVANRLYPNLLEAIRRATTHEFNITAVWKKQAHRIVAGISGERAKRFELIDSKIKEMFLQGSLNPALLLYAVYYPLSDLMMTDLENMQVREAVRDIASQLRRIRTYTEKVGGQVIVVAVPYPIYTDPRVNFGLLGWVIPDGNLVTTVMDDVLREAASQAGIPFFEVTQPFREKAREQTLHFEFDGHFNQEGHRLFAKLIEPVVAARLQAQK